MQHTITIVTIILFLFNCNLAYPQNIKKCEFAGSWYPADKHTLEALLDTLFAQVEATSVDGRILGIIAPHAGYVFSAPVAAYGFKILKEKKFDTVILLGPSHRYDFEGVSIYPQGIFTTPLGDLTVDDVLTSAFKDLSFVRFEAVFFNGEHCLEVELPFIKKVLAETKIVPILFGSISFIQMQELAKRLSQISSQKNVLIIVSTDLSHYHPYAKAVTIDKGTIELIENKDSQSLWNTRFYEGGRACGISPLITLGEYAKIKSAEVKILKYANSGDTAGDKSKVVGYLSAVFYLKDNTSQKEEAMQTFSLTNEDKKALLTIAREALASYFKDGKIKEFAVHSANLQEKRGAFVTLTKEGQLRGCIGRIVSDTALYKVIAEYAVHAAINDSRFPPVTTSELKDITIEISVLTPFEKVKDIKEIEVGKHGLMITKGFNSGLLLPQVPGEYGWDRETFLKHTCLKAGLAHDAYKDTDSILYKFSAIVFSEHDFR